MILSWKVTPSILPNCLLLQNWNLFWSPGMGLDVLKIYTIPSFNIDNLTYRVKNLLEVHYLILRESSSYKPYFVLLNVVIS